MKYKFAQRLVKPLMHLIGRWSLLLAIAGIGHAPAFAGQMEMRSQDQFDDQMMQSSSMTACPPCAICYMAPAPTVRKLGGNDRPYDMAAVTWIARVVPLYALHGTVPIAEIRPTIALRVLHCRWLN